MSPDVPTRIQDTLMRSAERASGETAIVDGARSWSYEQLLVSVGAASQALQLRGLKPGDRVAILLDKTVDSVVALYAVWSAGGVAVPVNETLKVRQVEHIVRDSGARILFTSRKRLACLDREIASGVEVVLADEPAANDRPLMMIAGPGGDQPAAILYTSGSTGRPKGIVISHANLLAGSRIVIRYLGIRSDNRLLSVLPFSFDYGLNQLLTTVAAGATLVLHRSHLPADICRALVEHGITGCAGVPPMWIQLMSDASPFPQLAFPRLRYITNSGGRFPVALFRQYRQQLPHVRIFLMYGLSEAFRSTCLDPDEADRRPDSMGKAVPETGILVLDPDGNPCPPEVAGELVHHGPTVALGYWNDPEATARVFRTVPLPGIDGPARVVFSGDLVRSDADGFLYFAGRRDHLIKSQGYRISPEEVEEIILASGLVDEVAVCGRSDEVSGQVVIAHVVAKTAAADFASRLESFCRREMPGYMQPRQIVLRESLPRTASGKFDRKLLTDEI
ncbi:MAG: AMP-binding protein [Gemmatimonadetes bacterium]|nr:AMP-binding protein [Gemmatimonadota bacterium]